MSAIGVAQAADSVVILGKEKRGVSTVGGVLIEEPVYGLEKLLRLIQGNGALTAEVRLEIGHQERGGYAFTGDIADDESDPLLSQIQEIVIVAADLASLDAESRVFQCRAGRQGLRKEPGLDLFGNFELLRGAAFQFEFFGDRAALSFYGMAHCVEAHERKRVPVEIFEACKDTAPDGCRFLLRHRGNGPRVIQDAPEPGRMTKANSALAPFAKFGRDIISDEYDLGGAADELELFRIRTGRDQRKYRASVGWRHGHPAFAGLKAAIEGEVEPELIQVKAQASLLVANVDVHRVKAKVRITRIWARSGHGWSNFTETLER